MARWSDLADWRGPTANQGGAMVEQRGVVLHIAEGWYEGTISWQRNASARVSSHFILGRASGEAAQMVDTDRTAWTQRDGNGRWLSIEFAGFTRGHRLNPGGWERLTAWQIERAAQIVARGHQVYGYPLQLANSPSGRGIGYHGMGGAAWGNTVCPGPDIIAQRSDILARARQIASGQEDEMAWDERIELPDWQRDRWPGDPAPGWRAEQWLRMAGGHSRALREELADVPGQLAAILAAAAGEDVAALVQQHATEARQHREQVEARLGAVLDDIAALVAEPGERDAAEIVDEIARRLGGSDD